MQLRIFDWIWRQCHKKDRPDHRISSTGRTRNQGIAAHNDMPLDPSAGICSPGVELARVREAAGEHHQCPECGSRCWAVVQGINGHVELIARDDKRINVPVDGMIQCLDCREAATDNGPALKLLADAGIRPHPIADFAPKGA